MVDTVTVLKKKLTAQEGSWVRSHKLSCASAQHCPVLTSVMPLPGAVQARNRNEVEVKLVPRVDTNDYSEFDEAEAKKRRAKVPADALPMEYPVLTSCMLLPGHTSSQALRPF
eukprot:642832-Rhodomonas_salina.2